ncbi:membrane protein [Streptomyces avidinii]
MVLGLVGHMEWSSIALVACSVPASLLLLALMGRYVPEHWHEHHALKDTLDHFSGLNRTLFSFILALSIVSAQTSLTKASEDVSREGASLINLQWATRPLPATSRERVRDLTHQYTLTVIDEEWPAMAKGGSSTHAQSIYDDLRRTLQDTQGSSKQEEVFARDSLVALREVGDARRARILAVSHGIPSYLWMGLLLSALLLVVAAAVQIRAVTWTSVFSIGLLTLLVSAVLAVLSAMNHPYSGGIHVEPEPLKFALKRFTAI